MHPLIGKTAVVQLYNKRINTVTSMPELSYGETNAHFERNTRSVITVKSVHYREAFNGGRTNPNSYKTAEDYYSDPEVQARIAQCVLQQLPLDYAGFPHSVDLIADVELDGGMQIQVSRTQPIRPPAHIALAALGLPPAYETLEEAKANTPEDADINLLLVGTTKLAGLEPSLFFGDGPIRNNYARIPFYFGKAKNNYELLAHAYEKGHALVPKNK